MQRIFAFISALMLALVMSPFAMAQDVADKITDVANKIPTEGAALMGIAIVLELALRVVKTQKPLSILHLVAKTLHAVSGLVEKVAGLLDKVLPQRTQ